MELVRSCLEREQDETLMAGDGRTALDLARLNLTIAQSLAPALGGEIRVEINLSEAPSVSRHRTITYRTTVNLTRLREIMQELADLFGLTLPVILKSSSPQIAPAPRNSEYMGVNSLM